MRSALAAVVALALSLVACGGDDGKERTSADYLKETNVTCREFTSKLDALFTDFDPANDAQLRRVAARYVELVHQLADDLRRIGYPKGQKRAADALYDQLDAWADQVQRNRNVFRAKREPAGFVRVETLARRVGLGKCGAQA